MSVDGNDAIAVAEAASEAIERARRGGGPSLLEGVTYRIHGHHMGDPGTDYRTEEEIAEWKSPKKDPISRLYSRLLEASLITEEENKEIEAKLSEELDEAVEFALNSPEIEPADVFQDTVFLLGENIVLGGGYNVTRGLSDEFGTTRVLDTPLAEVGIVGAAIGAAIVGMRPIAELSYIEFSLIAYDMIINLAAKIRFMTAGQVKVPLVITAQEGGGVSATRADSDSTFDAARCQGAT